MNRRKVLGCLVGAIAFPLDRLFRRRPRVENRKLTICSEIDGWDFENCEITGDESGNAVLRDCRFINSIVRFESGKRLAVLHCQSFLKGNACPYQYIGYAGV